VVQNGVSIDANTVRRIDARLQVASVTESIVVEGSGRYPADRPYRPQHPDLQEPDHQSADWRADAIFSRCTRSSRASRPTELHSDAGNPQRAMGTDVNGASYSNNNTRIDGATVSYPWLPHIVAYVPPQDAIETVNVVSNSFDAEQGMAGGAAMNVTIKSGTNEYHGSAHRSTPTAPCAPVTFSTTAATCRRTS
jgi:hypothetical protein